MDSLEVDTDLEVDLGSLVVVLMVDINLVVGIVLVVDIDLMVVLDSLVVDLVVDISLEEDTTMVEHLDIHEVVDLDNLEVVRLGSLMVHLDSPMVDLGNREVINVRTH